MTEEMIDYWRRRADALWQTAAKLETTPLLTLGDGVDTAWSGPVATAYASALQQMQGHVHTAVEDLRWQAYQFNRHADDLADELAVAGLDAAIG